MADQNIPNTGWAMHTRKDRRRTIPRSERIYLDFDDPRVGKRWRVRLLDISVGGVSFPSVDDRPSVDEGDRLPRAVIHAGGWKISGQLQVTYRTRPTDRRCVCGAEFTAASEADRLRLKAMVADLAPEEGEENGGLCPESLELQV